MRLNIFRKYYFYFQIFKFLKRSQLNTLFLIIILTIVVAFLDLLSVFIIIPFVNVLLGEKLPEILVNFFNYFNLTFENSSNLYLLIFTSILALGTSFFSSGFRMVVLIKKENFIAEICNYLSVRAFNNVISQNYNWHIKNESTDTIVKLNLIDKIYSDIISPILIIFSSFITSLVIFSGMIIYSPKTTFFSLFLLSFSYLSILNWCKKRLEKNSIGKIKENKNLFKIMKDSLSGIRELILNDEKDFVLKLFKESDKKLKFYNAEVGYLSLAPKYFIEFLSIFIVIFIGLLVYENNSEPGPLISSLAFFAFSLLKLIPHAQAFYSSMTAMRANRVTLKDYIELQELKDFYSNQIGFNRKIDIENFFVNNLTYHFSNSNKKIIDDFNVSFKKGDFVVLAGPSGSGKTTLCDLLMGLIEPDSGDFFFTINNKVLKVNPYDLRKNSVHVPQEVFIFNDSIINNIIRKSKINNEALDLAMKAACLDQFVRELPQGVETIIGERGSFLSGGQRQRIGLARAIYMMLSEAKFILFLDESTSALDTITEIKVIKNLKNLFKDKITIIISHRKNTFNLFDKVIKLNELKKLKKN
tara:strand:- start:1431 stop:3185 length:1755 start_codon:yes stop_codon:yes gene_type:complete